MKLLGFCFLYLLFLGGCYQVSSDDGDFRVVPVTNNPTIMPEGAFSKQTAMPY